eukprot:TRINITY_DN2110_c0_g2_i1.p2 TRINITY_DN2110_c0_g2~~TRINITY_DN2110_c0_g2_i1.p2  ORF type:complete len:104 (-),score=41.39 TRINITY_DN2110_c0_g2_i1:255-566(-)
MVLGRRNTERAPKPTKSMVKGKASHPGYKKRREEEERKRLTKELAEAYKIEVEEEKKLKREIIRQKRMIKEKNEKRGEVVQVIKDPKKLKKMSKKQLRRIENR